MRASVTSTTTGDTLLESVLVVTLHDGRLGFVATPAQAEMLLAEPQVTLSGPDHAVSGMADVVRSGLAYEEVQGRTRMAKGLLPRLTDRVWPKQPSAVVLVSHLPDA